MTEPEQQPRRPSGCAVLVGCLGAVVASVFVIVHAVTTWMSGHPWAVIAVAACAAGGGTLGGWLANRTDRRRGGPGT